jgi:hypothetical protein
MDTNPILSYFPFLAIITPIVLFFSQIKAAILKIFSLFIIKVEMNEDASVAFNYYSQEKAKRWSLGSIRYNSTSDYSRIDKKRISIGYEELGHEPQFVKIGKAFLLIHNKKLDAKDTYSYEAPKNTLIYYIRGTFNHEKYLIEAFDFFNSRQEKERFKIIIRTGDGKRILIGKKERSEFAASFDNSDVYKSNRILKYNRQDLGSVQTKEDIQRGYVFCSQGTKLLEDSKKWFESADWYRQHGILWRRGVLIHGLQGSGKSSLVRKICQIIDIPLYSFDLSSMSNKEFLNNWLECQADSPCAVLFDDLDKVFDKQKNITGENGGGLSFDAFLSALSGAQPSEGMLVFCTANNIKKIDKTLAIKEDGIPSRPGRIDSIISINEMKEEDRRALAKDILSESSLDIEKIIKDGHGMTAAQFNNFCSNISLDNYWKNKK